MDEVLAARIQALEIEQLESLGEAWLDFTALNDLVLWLNRYSEPLNYKVESPPIPLLLPLARVPSTPSQQAI